MKFTGRYRFRLIIGLPLVVICFTLAAGFFPLGMLDYVQLTPDLRSLVLNLKLAVLLIALVAAAVSVMMTTYIVRPVERIINEIEELPGRRDRDNESDDRSEDRRMDDEIDGLSKLYNNTLVPMKGYLKTADLFLQMSESIVSLNADGKIAFLNAPAARLFGIERQHYTGRHYEDIFPNSTRNFEIRDLIEEAVQSGSARSRDILVSTLSGRDMYVRATVSPATGRRRESIGVVMLFQDIEELSRLRDQLRRMDVLASIGGTITGMAHEVKTPLGYIRGLAELLKDDLPKDAPQQKYLHTIMESIDRLNVMVEEILSLAAVKIDASETYDSSVIVREALAYVRGLAREKDLRFVEDYTTSHIKADRNKLIETFINILKNACEAAPTGAAISIRTRYVTLGQIHGENATVMIEFHNEGSYIPPETKDRLFTPFFTTKKKGTGLGLAISKQIIEAHGGAIHVESDPNSGTLFRVLLPAKSVSESPQPAESAAK